MQIKYKYLFTKLNKRVVIFLWLPHVTAANLNLTIALNNVVLGYILFDKMFNKNCSCKCGYFVHNFTYNLQYTSMYIQTILQLENNEAVYMY